MKRIGIIILTVLLARTAVASAQEWSVSTNVAGLAELGTFNIEASYGVQQHWSVNAGARYNPFTFQSSRGQFQTKQRTISVGSRWWPWHIWSGWWVAAKTQYQEYNFGGIVSDRTEEGDKVGVSLGAGYTYMLHPHLNIEFGLAGWTGYKWYTVYACPRCGAITDSGAKAFVLPDEIILSLSYVF